MDAIDAIMTRRSIRRYQERPVESAKIETLLRAAMAAPSAGNQQPWRFVVLTDAARRARAANTSPFATMLVDAPLGIVICGDTSGLKHPGMWDQDCSAATQNLLLAAHALGLGAVWLGYHPKQERVAALREVLALPSHIEPLAIVAIGYPAEERGAVDRYDPTYVHHEGWEADR